MDTATVAATAKATAKATATARAGGGGGNTTTAATMAVIAVGNCGGSGCGDGQHGCFQISMREDIQKLSAMGINMNKNKQEIIIFCLGGGRLKNYQKGVLCVF